MARDPLHVIGSVSQYKSTSVREPGRGRERIGTSPSRSAALLAALRLTGRSLLKSTRLLVGGLKLVVKRHEHNAHVVAIRVHVAVDRVDPSARNAGDRGSARRMRHKSHQFAC